MDGARPGHVTERLYYDDARLTQFSARVIDRRDDGRRIYLDRTAFYPTSGGQPHDTGSLGGLPVVDVVDEDDAIAHVLGASLAESAMDVAGRVDWERRFDHMQQHTGQHLLSAIFADRFGYETVSVHFGADVSTLDLSVETVPHEHLIEAESLANAVVGENRPVDVTYADATTAQGLRKPPAREGTIRVVSIAGLDRSACGGTHVRGTAEVGTVLLRRQEKMKKQARIEFLCGTRAIRRARADFELLARLGAGLSASVDEIGTLVPAQARELHALQNTVRRMQDEVAGFRAAQRYGGTTAAADGNRYVVDRLATGSADEARAFALALTAHPRAVYLALFAASRTALLAASDDAAFDCGKRLREALATLHGKGGGSARLAQGTLPDTASLERLPSALGIPTHT
jgi:alanyl-tRNA synthetase